MYSRLINVVLIYFLSVSAAFDPRIPAQNDQVMFELKTENIGSATMSTPQYMLLSQQYFWPPHSLAKRTSFAGSGARVLSPAEMKVVLKKQEDELAHTKKECTTWQSCHCEKKPGGSASGASCMNYKCYCGKDNAPIAAVENAFAKPVLEGLAKAGKEIQKVVGGLEFAVKMALHLGSWLIPGLGKTAAKALDAAIPLDKTGNAKADAIMQKIAEFT